MKATARELSVSGKLGYILSWGGGSCAGMTLYRALFEAAPVGHEVPLVAGGLGVLLFGLLLLLFDPYAREQGPRLFSGPGLGSLSDLLGVPLVIAGAVLLSYAGSEALQPGTRGWRDYWIFLLLGLPPLVGGVIVILKDRGSAIT